MTPDDTTKKERGLEEIAYIDSGGTDGPARTQTSRDEAGDGWVDKDGEGGAAEAAEATRAAGSTLGAAAAATSDVACKGGVDDVDDSAPSFSGNGPVA